MKVRTEYFKNNRFILLLLILFFKCSYDYLIVVELKDLIKEERGYYLDFSAIKYVISFITLIVVYLCSISRKVSDSTSNYLIFVLFLIYYIPINDIYGQCNASSVFFILINIHWLILIFCMKIICNRNLYFHDFKLKLSLKSFNLLFFLDFLLIVFFTYRFNGLHIDFNLGDVYEMRENNNELGQIFTMIKGTYIAWIGPLLICFYLMRRKYLYSLVAIAGMIVLFSVGKDKFSLFIILPLVVISYFNKLNYKQMCMIFCGGLCTLTLLCILETLLLESNILSYTIVRRTFFVPQYLNYLYYDFFSQNEKIYFTDQVFLISRILPDIYPNTIHELIDNKYFGYMPSPNTGMFSEAYMHIGFIGLFVFPIIMAIFFSFCNSLTCHYPSFLKFIVAVLLSMSLISVPITSSHFIILFICSIIFYAAVNHIFIKYPSLT